MSSGLAFSDFAPAIIGFLVVGLALAKMAMEQRRRQQRATVANGDTGMHLPRGDDKVHSSNSAMAPNPTSEPKVTETEPGERTPPQEMRTSGSDDEMGGAARMTGAESTSWHAALLPFVALNPSLVRMPGVTRESRAAAAYAATREQTAKTYGRAPQQLGAGAAVGSAVFTPLMQGFGLISLFGFVAGMLRLRKSKAASADSSEWPEPATRVPAEPAAAAPAPTAQIQ